MNKVRIGIVGAGRIGNVHAQSITYHIPQAEVVCVTDVNEAAAKKLAETYGIPRYGADFHMIIDDPDVDAVLADLDKLILARDRSALAAPSTLWEPEE